MIHFVHNEQTQAERAIGCVESRTTGFARTPQDDCFGWNNQSDTGLQVDSKIPQNRERIYIVGFLKKKAHSKFEFPKESNATLNLADFIDFDSKVDDSFYYNDKYMTKELVKSITSQDTVYQWRRHYVRENKSGLCPTLTANMGTGGHNVPLVLTKHGIRKLTPRECFNLMGFPKSFKLPTGLANSQLYKQAGNAVVVPVVKRIAVQIMKAID